MAMMEDEGAYYSVWSATVRNGSPDVVTSLGHSGGVWSGEVFEKVIVPQIIQCLLRRPFASALSYCLKTHRNFVYFMVFIFIHFLILRREPEQYCKV